MKILLSSEHAGYQMKIELSQKLKSSGFQVENHGALSDDPVDYPPIIEDATLRVVRGEFDLGIFLCGTGIGVSIAASKIPGAVVALCNNSYMARMAKEHNNANVLCLGSRVVGIDHGFDIVKTFLITEFEGGRHLRRLEQVQSIEMKYKLSSVGSK
jgi:ribose 5-phosphate isomerase B